MIRALESRSPIRGPQETVLFARTETTSAAACAGETPDALASRGFQPGAPAPDRCGERTVTCSGAIPSE